MLEKLHTHTHTKLEKKRLFLVERKDLKGNFKVGEGGRVVCLSRPLPLSFFPITL